MLVSLLLLLAAASVHAGDFYEQQYGSTIRIRMRGSAHSLIFVPTDGSESVILWKLDDPSFSTYRRGVINGYLVINDLTQRDNGNYKMMSRNDKLLVSHNIEVVAHYKNFELKGQELLTFTYPLDTKNCNIYFFPDDQEYSSTKYDTELVRSGRKVNTWSSHKDFEFVNPCGLEMEMHESWSGHFEVRDQYDGVALSVQVNWMGEPFNLGHIGTSIGAFLASIFFCCCVRRCCCGKSSKKKDADSAAAEPAVTYNKYRNEPVALRSVQMLSPSETLYPAQPSYAPTGPLIHNPPTVNVPRAYSEVSAPAEQEHTPSFSPSSDSDLRFELKGMNISSAPPLSSDPTYNSVYTSNKLNFL